jgi:hypothetical protein
MLGAACELLPGCADEISAQHCQEAIAILIEMVGGRLSPEIREAMLRSAVEQARREPAIREMTKFDVSLGTRGMYEKVPSLNAGVNQYVLKTDVEDISYGIKIVIAFSSALGEAFLPFVGAAVEIVRYWLGLPVRVRDIFREVLALLATILQLLRSTNADPDAESELLDQVIGTIARLLSAPSVSIEFESVFVRGCILVQQAAAKCPWFDGARLIPLMSQLPVRIDGLIAKREALLELWSARSELIHTIELEIQDWAALSEVFLKKFPAVAIPFFDECLVEKAQRWCQSEGSVYTGITMLTAFFSIHTSTPDRVFAFIEFLLGVCGQFHSDYSDRAFECLGTLFSVYELPTAIVEKVFDFFNQVKERDDIDSFYDWSLFAFTKMIIRNQATIDFETAMEIWIECLTVEIETNLLPLDVVMTFLIEQLAARNPVLFTENAIARWLVKVVAACIDPQTPANLKSKIKEVFLGFDETINEAIREEGLEQRETYWEEFCQFLAGPS